MTRRSFLNCCAVSAAWASVPLARGANADARAAVAGAFDREVEAFMSARKIPGGALAVVKDRRLVYARGYGWADQEKQTSVNADSLFRIASISKPFTATAVLKLVEQGKLDLNASAFGLLKPLFDTKPPRDARFDKITVRQLLQHTGGWDRDKSGDPMFRCQTIARAQEVACPPGPLAIIRYMRGRELDFDPGTRYAYSNFGYCVLGRIIEQITGVSYEAFVREQVLKPMGITRMKIGASLRSGAGEVSYFTPKDEKGRSVFPDTERSVPVPYGTFYLEAMDAHGAWIASAVDLARSAAALADPDLCPVLKPESLRTMAAPPPVPVSRGKDGALNDSYYACGWMIRPVGKAGKANAWHTGSLPGTFTLLVRRWDGLSWAVLFNQRSEDKKLPDGAIDPALHRAADAVKNWPEEDGFAR